MHMRKLKFRASHLLFSVFCFCYPAISFADTKVVAKETMSFEQCIAVIQNTASDLGVAPINIVETNFLRIVRFPTSDGSLLVTCSGPDKTLLINHTTP